MQKQAEETGRGREGGRKEGCGHKLRVIVPLLLLSEQLFVEV